MMSPDTIFLLVFTHLLCFLVGMVIRGEIRNAADKELKKLEKANCKDRKRNSTEKNILGQIRNAIGRTFPDRRFEVETSDLKDCGYELRVYKTGLACVRLHAWVDVHLDKHITILGDNSDMYYFGSDKDSISKAIQQIEDCLRPI